MTLDELRALEAAATPGPWAWRWPSGSRDGPTIVHPKSGLLLVIDAVRSGMNAATLRFARRTDSMGGTMHNADSWMPHRGGDRPDYQTPTSPDMQMLTAARNALPALLAVAEACKGLMRRMEINELVNRPGNPCNHYDQPYYDAAKDALVALEKEQG